MKTGRPAGNRKIILSRMDLCYAPVTGPENTLLSPRLKGTKVRLATFVIPSRCFGIESGLYGPFKEAEELWAADEGSCQFRHHSLTARFFGKAHATNCLAHGRRCSDRRRRPCFRNTEQVDGPVLSSSRAEFGGAVSSVSGDAAECPTGRDRPPRVPLSTDDGG